MLTDGYQIAEQGIDGQMACLKTYCLCHGFFDAGSMKEREVYKNIHKTRS